MANQGRLKAVIKGRGWHWASEPSLQPSERGAKQRGWLLRNRGIGCSTMAGWKPNCNLPRTFQHHGGDVKIQEEEIGSAFLKRTWPSDHMVPFPDIRI